MIREKITLSQLESFLFKSADICWRILDATTQKGSEFQQRLAKLRSLKTALMQDLLTGRKRVTNLLNNPEIPA